MKPKKANTGGNASDSNFTEEFLTHALTPSNVGLFSNPDGYGAPKGACGDSMEIGLKVCNNIINEIVFMPDGCAHTIACGSLVTTLAKGKTLTEALEIKSDYVMELLGGLPQEHVHCARLAVTTLRLAVKDCLKNQRSPWKKLYKPNDPGR